MTLIMMMNKQKSMLLFAACSSLTFCLLYTGASEVYAVPHIVNLDKSSYVEGDIIMVSGTVSYAPTTSSGIALVSSPGDTPVAFKSFTPDSDGSFNVQFPTVGVKWIAEGSYSVKISYNEITTPKPFEYKLYSNSLDTVITTRDTSSTDSAQISLQELSLDKSSYGKGDTITVSGKTTIATPSGSSPADPVTIRVIAPAGKLIDVSRATIGSNGEFSTTFQVTNKWRDSGNYLVKAFLGSYILEKSLSYQNGAAPVAAPTTAPVDTISVDNNADNRDSNTDTLLEPSTTTTTTTPNTPSAQTAQQQQEQQPPTPTTSPSSSSSSSSSQTPSDTSEASPPKLASFVEAGVDPQQYVDRYNTDPAYKTWFDENFASEFGSIYKAVGLSPPDMGVCGMGTTLVNGICKLDEPTTMTTTTINSINNDNNNNKNGCLIATAAYGSEMAPQVQLLRELRDYTILQTQSGSVFMDNFNLIYYSFSPIISDWQRQNPIFKEAVKFVITPLISSLAILNHVTITSETDMISYGIAIITMNAILYFAVPAILIWRAQHHIRIRFDNSSVRV